MDTRPFGGPAPVDVVSTAVRARCRPDVGGGSRVFCEKPVAVSLEAAAHVAEEAERASGVFVVDHVLRYNLILRLLQRLGGEGLLYPLRQFAFENDASDEDLGPDHWFWDPARSGGIHIEHGVHFFDATSALMGSGPVEVQGMAVRRPSGPVDIVVATATHPRGSVATHTHSFTHAPPRRAAVDAPGLRLRRTPGHRLDPHFRDGHRLDRRRGRRPLGATARAGGRPPCGPRAASARAGADHGVGRPVRTVRPPAAGSGASSRIGPTA
ncbi:Gfo/Idh/MocA family protein [Streptomyces sp. NPDC001156]